MNRPAPPLDDALAAWDEYCATAGIQPTSRDYYRRLAQRFLCWLESTAIELRQVNESQVEEFLNAQGVMPTTRFHYRSMLRRFFDALLAHHFLDVNPLGDGRNPLRIPRAGNVPNGAAMPVAEEFSTLSEVEKQATVDAAAAALLMHDIYAFTEGKEGMPADVERCEEALQLGEQHGVTPFSWAECDSPATEAQPARADEPAAASTEADQAKHQP
jgi:hypothetical protein